MPHVSLVTDIVQLFGTSSVPVIVGGSVLGVFELGERLHLNELKMLGRNGFSHSTYKKQKHFLTARKSYLREFLVSVTFR
jgi:hypothetical protein